MAITRIATTRQRDLQPLGTAGQTAIECWSVLSTLLMREIDPAHAALLAEPVVNPGRGETDWYADGNTPAVPLTMADPTTRDAAKGERTRLEEDIRALAARKRAAVAESDRFLGDMLLLALSVPGDDHVYVVDGHPVLIAWGHAPSGGAPEQVALTGLREGPPGPMEILPPPVLPTAVTAQRRWWLPVLLAALLLPLLALLLFFLDPFGWYVVAAPTCRVAAAQPALLGALQDATAREIQLRAQLAQVTDDAARRHLQCPPIVVPAAVTPAPSQDVQRAAERGAHSGKMQIILAWQDRSDLDLHVFCPDGTEISFAHKDACGGHLDLDANSNSTTATATPVENVYFEDPGAGSYRIVVNPYALRGTTASDFRITIRRDGLPDQVVTGVAHDGVHNQVVTTVEVTR